MTFAQDPSKPIGRADVYLAVGVGVVALACYMRTLAPDILFGDSAEYQTLGYTLGIAHSTGYPTYLLLAKLLTFIPLGTVAWRVNLLSALCGAGALVGLYFLIRQLTSGRAGAVLGCLALGTTYTLWSQSSIAETYSPAALCIVGIMLCLWHWQGDPLKRNLSLAAACLLVGIGIHAMVELTPPAIVVFVIWTLAGRPKEVLEGRRLPFRHWLRSFLFAMGGVLCGAAIFLVAFWAMDLHNPATSFIQTTLIPSRSLWGATSADLATYWQRLYATVVSLQWRGALYSGDPNYMISELSSYLMWTLGIDFNFLVVILSLLGLWVILRRNPHWGAFMLVTGLVLLFIVVNYKVTGKHVYYLATYILMAVAAGAALQFLLNSLRRRFLVKARPRLNAALYPLAVILLGLLITLPVWGARFQSLKEGRLTFYEDTYTYPRDLTEPRRVAELTLQAAPDNAVILMGWQALFSTAYLANVEKGRTNILFREASPYPSDGNLPDTLVDEVNAFLKEGRPVYVDSNYKNIRDHFRTRPAQGTSKLIELLLK